VTLRAALLAIALASAPASAETWDSPPPFNAATKGSLQAAVKDRLLDGDSAKWRWLPFRNDQTTVAQYCGFVNAKNRMGGYIGFNPVWVTGYWKDGAFVPLSAEFASGPYMDGLAARMCVAAGYSMDKIPPE
jgi:hypothetical protein